MPSRVAIKPGPDRISAAFRETSATDDLWSGKPLTPERRKELSDGIKQHALDYDIATGSLEEVNQLDYFGATVLAMQDASAGFELCSFAGPGSSRFRGSRRVYLTPRRSYCRQFGSPFADSAVHSVPDSMAVHTTSPTKTVELADDDRDPGGERTQAELAYQELSHRILIFEIAPNERIVEQAWATKLQVNRAAIRESLTRLLGEGLVYQGQRGGFFVSEMSDEEIHQVREVREILETGALALACERASARQVKDLEETVNDFGNFVRKGYFTGAHEADLRFHQLLVAASGNQRLIELYQRSHIPLFQRKEALIRAPLEDFIQTEREHRLVVDALRKKDIKAGVAALREHFNRGEKDALSQATT